MKTRQFLGVAACALGLTGVWAASASAGEVTGNGKPLWTNTTDWSAEHMLHGKSACAFSGQEDLQFLDEEGNPLAVTHKGVPSHAQSWGQIPKTAPVGEISRDFLTSIGSNPGIACNPTSPAPTEP